MVRIEKGNHYLVSKALQVGAGALLVSDIENVQEAVQVVRSAKFAPQGVRGYSSYSFAAGWGSQGGEDWVKWSNSQIPVGIMVENEQIISCIEEVMAIEGLDYCLSLGLGAPRKNHPQVTAALEQTIDAAAKHGKAVGIGIGAPWVDNARKYIDMGCRFLELGHDLGVLRSVWQEASRAISGLTRE